MKNIRVVIADDHNVMRAALAKHLNQFQDIEIVGEVCHCEDILQTTFDLYPDVVLLDAKLMGHRLVNIIQELRRHNPSTHLLILSAYDNYDFIVTLLKTGVSGLLLKEDRLDNLIEAIRAVSQDKEYLSLRSVEILINAVTKKNGSMGKITKREQEVLGLIAKGYKNHEIAKELVITLQTVKNHVRNIFNKLGVESRIEAVIYGINHGIVNVHEQDNFTTI